MNVSGIKIQKLTNRRAKKGKKRMLATAKKEGKRANVVGVVLVLFLAIVCIGALQHFIFASSPVGSNPRYTLYSTWEAITVGWLEAGRLKPPGRRNSVATKEGGVQAPARDI